MIANILKNAYEEKRIVDINIYETEEESVVGYITNIRDNCFTIKEIDKFGYANGTTVYSIDSIKNISLDNWYLRNLLVIIENNNTLHQDSRVTIHKKGKELISHFEYLKKNKKITMLFFEDENYELGIVLNYDEDFVIVKDIGQDGYELGITYYRINDIIGLQYDGLGEQKTELLYKKIKDTGGEYIIPAPL